MSAPNEEADIKQVVQALARAVREHGAPNSFSPGELTQLYGCRLSCLRVGQVLHRYARQVYEQLALVGLSGHYAQQRYALAYTLPPAVGNTKLAQLN